MKRLRDMEAHGPLEQKAQQLVASVEPVDSSPERMAVIRRRLDEPRGLTVALRRMPALALAALIGLFGASAFAAVRVFVELRSEGGATEQAPRGAEPKRAVNAREEPPDALAPIIQEGTQIEASDVAREPSRKSVARSRAKHRESRVSTPRVSTPAEEAAHDSELVHRAVKALRRDGNPKLAARLLDEDRVRNPSGPLAEEALSLRIEAAIELGESRARTLAQQYLTRYPNGRYLAIARRALEGSDR
jgi:hypothetical protein